MIYSFIKNQFYQRSKKILYQYSKKNSRKNLYEFIEKALDEYEIISFEKTLNIGYIKKSNDNKGIIGFHSSTSGKN